MKLTNALKHMEFGNLGVYVRGLISYTISPYEQRAFAGISKRLPRLLQRIFGNVIYVVPPFAIGYWVHEATEKKFDRMCRKNPEDYVNDK